MQSLPALLTLALLALLAAAPVAQAQPLCAAGSFVSGSACAACPAGTSSVGGAASASACRPSGTTLAFTQQGPTDAVLSFTADEAEGLGAFSVIAPWCFAHTADMPPVSYTRD
jgi:hypothetical protein